MTKRKNRYNVVEFIYRTKDKRELKLQEMETDHLERARIKHLNIAAKCKEKLENHEDLADIFSIELLRRKQEGIQMTAPSTKEAVKDAQEKTSKLPVKEMHEEVTKPKCKAAKPKKVKEEVQEEQEIIPEREEETKELVIHNNYGFKVK